MVCICKWKRPIFNNGCQQQDMENIDNYAALIIRKDNPHFADYVSEFNKTVNMFRVKPE